MQEYRRSFFYIPASLGAQQIAVSGRDRSRNLTVPRKVKVKVHTLDIAPLRSESLPQNRSGMARVLEGFHSFTCTPTRSSAIGMSHTCVWACLRLAFPAITDTHLPTPEGWKDE